MNKRRAALLDEYKFQKKADPHMQTCKVCGERSPKAAMEPHHPAGRRGDSILNYFWLHPLCHRWCHDNPKEAENRGLLTKGRNL